MQLHCTTRGVESETKIILLHGLFGSHRNLLPIARAFEQQYQLLLPDMRNHGKSFHADQIDYQLMSDDLSHLLEQQQIKKAIFIGHSMGGKIAMVHALSHPHQVEQLVVMDIAPVNYDHDYETVIENLLNLDLNTIQSRNDADTELQQHYKNKDFRDFLLQNLQRDQGQFRWRANLAALKKNLPAICQFPNLIDQQFCKPTLFLAGSESKYVHDKYRQTIAEYFPKYQLQYLANAGHWLHAQQPEQVIAKISEFIDNSPSSQASPNVALPLQ